MEFRDYIIFYYRREPHVAEDIWPCIFLLHVKHC